MAISEAFDSVRGIVWFATWFTHLFRSKTRCPNPQCAHIVNPEKKGIDCPQCGAELEKGGWNKAALTVLFVNLAVVLVLLLVGYVIITHNQQAVLAQKQEISKLESQVDALRTSPEAVRLQTEVDKSKNELNLAKSKAQEEISELRKEAEQAKALRYELGRSKEAIASKEEEARQLSRQLDEKSDALLNAQAAKIRAESKLAKLEEDLKFAKSDLDEKHKLLQTAASVIQDKKQNRRMYRENWNKLNGWLAVGRAITSQHVQEVLGSPDRVKDSYQCVHGSGERDGKWWTYYTDDQAPHGDRGEVCFTEKGIVGSINPPDKLR